MKKNINKRAYFAAFLLFSVIPAFYLWGNIFLPILSVVFPLVFLIEALHHGTNKRKVFIIIYTSFVLLWYVIASGVNIFGTVLVLTPVLLLLPKSSFHVRVFDAFLRVFALIMGVSVLTFILVVLLGVNLPHIEIQPLNEFKLESYYLFPFFVTTDGIITPFMIRFMGFFDEPGVVGTLCAIILMTERFDLKKWENIIILIAGIVSMSFFFFIICFVYILMIVPFNQKILIILAGIVIIISLQNNELINDTLFSRFIINDGQFEGMNREHGDFTSFFNNFRHTNAYWTGLGPGHAELLNDGGSSYKQVIVDYGVVFFGLYMSCFFLNALSIIKKPSMIFVYSILILGTMYQRPFVGVGSLALFYLMMAIPYRIVEKY